VFVVLDRDGSKVRLYMGSVGLCTILVMSWADRVCFQNESGGRPAAAHKLSAGLVGNTRRAKRSHVFWVASRRPRSDWVVKL